MYRASCQKTPCVWQQSIQKAADVISYGFYKERVHQENIVRRAMTGLQAAGSRTDFAGDSSSDTEVTFYARSYSGSSHPSRI
jgi:hypothetical protein